MSEYAVAITFPQTSTAYEALSKLSPAPGGFEIRSAAIVERDKDGHLSFSGKRLDLEGLLKEGLEPAT